jgi:hypothetical protein
MPQHECPYCGRKFKSIHPRPYCGNRACSYKYRGDKQRLPWNTRLWTHVTKTDTCWYWTGALDRDGYGRLTDYSSPKPKPVHAHRLSWTLHRGPVPAGLCVLHKCDVRNCVRPDHLFLGTSADNTADMVAKGRHRKGAQINTCKMTEDQVRELLKLTQQGVPQIELARRYGIDRNSVYRIQTRQNWKHIQVT